MPAGRLLAPVLAVPLLLAAAIAPAAFTQSSDDSDARPPVAKSDIDIVKRAREILNSPEKWNRADNRVCPDTEKTFSLYCALEKATDEVTHDFAHRGAAMQEARFVIDDVLAPHNKYDHRLMDYNNDPKTTFADVQRFFGLLQQRIENRLQDQKTNPQSVAASSVGPVVTRNDIAIAVKAQQILNSPAKWDRNSTQDCKPDAKTFGLYCLFSAASIAATGKFDEQGNAINEARSLISRTAPNATKYQARLVDYNNDPTVTFDDVQRLLKTVQSNLENRLTAQQK